MKAVVLSLCFLSALSPAASAQEVSFENLDFDVVHNAVDFSKADLVERVALIHLWGTT